jgi:hypothetical protein
MAGSIQARRYVHVRNVALKCTCTHRLLGFLFRYPPLLALSHMTAHYLILKQSITINLFRYTQYVCFTFLFYTFFFFNFPNPVKPYLLCIH